MTLASKQASSTTPAISTIGGIIHRHATKGTNFSIREVWKENLKEEFAHIRTAVVTHTIVAIDVEYPGVVARSITGPKDTIYEAIRCNVDLLNPIQIGFSLCDSEGKFPIVDGVEVGAWQFNFKFSLTEDMFATESIDLLERAGLNFDSLEDHGVSQAEFGELLIASGIVLDDSITMVNFQGGFSMAYLFKLMSCRDMPGTLDHFMDLLHMHIPVNYDLRYVQAKNNPRWNGGSLDALAAEYAAQRESTLPIHQAGSDAWLTLKTFLGMKQAKLIHSSYEGILYGLEVRPKSAPSSPGLPPGSNTYSSLHHATSTNDSENLQTPEKSGKFGGGGNFNARRQ